MKLKNCWLNVFIIVSLLIFAGCSPKVYLHYSGNQLPDEEVARIYDSSSVVINSIDGKRIYSETPDIDEIHVMPGQHKVIMSYTAGRTYGEDAGTNSVSGDEGRQVFQKLSAAAGKDYGIYYKWDPIDEKWIVEVRPWSGDNSMGWLNGDEYDGQWKKGLMYGRGKMKGANKDGNWSRFSWVETGLLHSGKGNYRFEIIRNSY